MTTGLLNKTTTTTTTTTTKISKKYHFSILSVSFLLLIHLQAGINCAQAPQPHVTSNNNGFSTGEENLDEIMEYMGNATTSDWEALFTADSNDSIYTEEELKELRSQFLPCRLETNFIPRFVLSEFLKKEN